MIIDTTLIELERIQDEQEPFDVFRELGKFISQASDEDFESLIEYMKASLRNG